MEGRIVGFGGLENGVPRIPHLTVGSDDFVDSAIL
jgi:hypothetical protein